MKKSLLLKVNEWANERANSYLVASELREPFHLSNNSLLKVMIYKNIMEGKLYNSE